MCLLSKKIFEKMFIKDPNKDHSNDNNIEDASRNVLMGPHFEEYVKSKIKYQDDFTNLPFEMIQITSKDGLKLVGRLYINPKKTNKMAILVHGYNSYGCREYCMTGYKYIDAGYNIFLPDNRGCGDSEGKYFTFGLRETEDLSLWIEEIVKRFPDSQIVLHGSSLGGATVLMQSNQDLPKNVKAIASDCAYSTMKKEFRFLTKKVVGLPFFPICFVNMYFKKYTGCDFYSRTPLDAVKQSKLQIIFLHGEEDRFVSYEQGQDLYNACTSEKEFVSIPNAGHVGAHVLGEEKFFSSLFNFLDKYVK